MGINKYLSKIQEEKEITKGDRLRCKVCGREVTVNKAGKGLLICCGQNMTTMGRVVEAGFSHYPKGWSQDSVKKFARSLSKNMKGGPKSRGFFDKCVNKMKDHVKDPEGFCAGIKDEVYGSTMWRGKDKSAAEVRKDTKKTQNV